MTKRHICALAASVLIIGACGSDGDSDEPADDSTNEASSDDATNDGADTGGDTGAVTVPDAGELEDAVAEDAQDAADEIADGLEDVQDAQGGGSATFTANGQTWEFPSVLCAFGEDQIGQPGAVFNLSAIDNGLQLYASIDDSGAVHSLSLNDIEDFENPSVSLSMNSLLAGAFGVPTEFLTLDGTEVTGSVVMIDDTTNQPTDAPAEFSATCP
jgi:hypothetical protein